MRVETYFKYYLTLPDENPTAIYSHQHGDVAEPVLRGLNLKTPHTPSFQVWRNLVNSRAFCGRCFAPLANIELHYQKQHFNPYHPEFKPYFPN